MKGIMYYCPVCANALSDSSEAKEMQIAEMKCTYCESELINTGKHMNEFAVYMGEHDGDADEAIREIYAYDNPLFDKEKCDKRVAKETAHQTRIDQLNSEVNEMRRSGSNAPKCPYCNSTNLTKITTGGRLVSTAFFGFASGKIGKQWHCNGCKSDF